MDDYVGEAPVPVLRAEIELLRSRLAAAQVAGRGMNMHRKEVSLAAAIMEAAVSAVALETINHKLTEQDNERQ